MKNGRNNDWHGFFLSTLTWPSPNHVQITSLVREDVKKINSLQAFFEEKEFKALNVFFFSRKREGKNQNGFFFLS